MSSLLDPMEQAYIAKLGVAPGWRCLELGCGNGSIARALATLVAPSGHVVASDIDLTYLGNLEMPGLEVLRIDVLRDEIETGFYDLVVARALLHHLTPASKALERMVDALKPGGVLLSVEPDMLMLWIFGDNIEDYLGHFKFLVFYLLCGFAATFTHILLNPTSLVPSVGASGAIAGVMGAYFILYPKARVLIWFPPIFIFHVPAWLMLGYWFVSQFIGGTATSIGAANQAGGGGIAFWAHVGGFVAGLLLIKLLPERPQRFRYGTW